MAVVELFGFAQSTYVRTARLVCEEKGIQYSLLPLEFREESHRAVHPYLRMPALRHGKLVLFETLAIAMYVNEQFPGPNLDAGTVAERAKGYQWISTSNDYIYKGIVGAIAKSDSVDPRVIDDAAPLLLPFDRALAKHDYLVGDELTLADLFLLPMLLFADKAIDKADWLSPLPHVADWLNRLKDRPSVISTEA